MSKKISPQRRRVPAQRRGAAPVRKQPNRKPPNARPSNSRTVPVKKKNSALDTIHSLFSYGIIIALVAFLYIAFVMPTNTPQGPVDNNSNTNNSTTVGKDDFNLYMYLNKADSSRGKLEADLNFEFKDGNKLNVTTLQNFKTKGKDNTIVGSTTYNWNGNSAVIDDYTYLVGGYRYVKNSTGYVKEENKNALEPGSLNIGQIWDSLTKGEEVIKEDGLSCYKYSGSMTYNKMSTTFRNYIRSQNVNIANIESVQLNVELFITETNLPYKIIFSFEEVGCMVKASNLPERNGKLSGSITITMGGFNGGDALDIPSEIDAASEGSYIFTDKVNRFLNGIGVSKD